LAELPVELPQLLDLLFQRHPVAGLLYEALPDALLEGLYAFAQRSQQVAHLFLVELGEPAALLFQQAVGQAFEFQLQLPAALRLAGLPLLLLCGEVSDALPAGRKLPGQVPELGLLFPQIGPQGVGLVLQLAVHRQANVVLLKGVPADVGGLQPQAQPKPGQQHADKEPDAQKQQGRGEFVFHRVAKYLLNIAILGHSSSWGVPAEKKEGHEWPSPKTRLCPPCQINQRSETLRPAT